MSGLFYMSIEPKEWIGWRLNAGLMTNARAEVADILSISIDMEGFNATLQGKAHLCWRGFA